MNLIYMGPPGCGKGTQNKLFEERHNLKPISTGDMFRQAIADKTEIGEKAHSYIEKGELVPDEVTNGIVKERLAKKDFKDGFILDGFPRTVAQADEFGKILAELGLSLDKIVFIDVPMDKLVARLSGRRTCKKCKAVYNVDTIGDKKECEACGGLLFQREDDKEDVIRQRLETYERETFPLIEYYQKLGLLLKIDGDGAPEEVYKKITSKLGLVG